MLKRSIAQNEFHIADNSFSFREKEKSVYVYTMQKTLFLVIMYDPPPCTVARCIP